MLIILVPVLLLALWLAVLGRNPDKGLRRAFLESLMILSAFVAVSTEVFSVFGAITGLAFKLLWIVAFAAVAVAFKRRILDGAPVFRRRFTVNFGQLPVVYSVPTFFIAFVMLVIALVSPPNTYDSMTYHMARIAHWIQSGSLAPFSTSILRQLYQPPFSEFAALHLQLLSGGDYFANLVQWLALIASCAVVSLIVQEFGHDYKIQSFAVLLTATMPAVILQSASTQNDLLASFFVVAFFYFLLLAVKSQTAPEFVFAGLALGLAILTKGLGYIYCFPIGAFFVVTHFFKLGKNDQRVTFAMRVALILALAVTLNAGHYVRNTQTFGSPVSTGEDKLSNRNMTPKMALANLVRNYSLHLGTSSFYLNNLIHKTITDAFGAELKNPDSTWRENEFSVVISMQEDRAGNFIHCLLITLCIVLLLFVRGDDKKYLYGAAFAVVTGFLLFVLLLKWQMWGSRLHLPVFLLGTALATIVVARIAPRAALPIAALAFMFALPFLIAGEPRHLIGNDGTFALMQPRAPKYFDNLPDLEPYYRDATSFLKSREATEVGLFFEDNDYEYPLWLMLKEDFSREPLIRHAGVVNVSKKFNPAGPPPEYVVTMREERKIDGYDYEVAWIRWPVAVLRRKNQP